MKGINNPPEFLQDERGSFVRIAMRHGQYLLVDVADWPEVGKHYWGIKHSRYTWYAERPRTTTDPHGSPAKISLHRTIAGLAHGDPQLVDHADGNGLNNRRYNLRPCTQSQNTSNTRGRRPPPSGRRGVRQVTGSFRWYAAIQENGRSRYLGSFDTQEEAAAVYTAAAKRLRGEFLEPALSDAPAIDKSHIITECERGEGTYHPSRLPKRNGGWAHFWHCPACGRKARFLDNLVRKHILACDGNRFIKQQRALVDA